MSLYCGIFLSVVDYCLGSVTMISDFMEYLQTDWSLKSSGVTGYMNALGHLLDFYRSYSDLTQIKSSVFIPSEIYIQQVKCYYPKKLKPAGEPLSSFIVAALFLMVKASHPMTCQFLTVQMVASISENGIINQTIFKTKEKYVFDSLIFSNDVLNLKKELY